MSEENLRRVQAVFDAYLCSDEPAMLAPVSSDVIVTQFPDRGTKRATLFHVHDGNVTRLVGYNDCDRALADLGLEE